MPTPPLTSIDTVLAALETIIEDALRQEDPLGYFAVLYHRVTAEVKQGIAADFFDDGPRMERLDVIFARRYIDAYNAYRRGEAVTGSWARAFELAPQYWPIVMQHLLIGINAHINLDLGIAAAEAGRGQPMAALQADFNRINTILAALVEEMQARLAQIWPRLHWVLQRTKQIDNHLVDFSMELARDGAWAFAQELAAAPANDWPAHIVARDERVVRTARIITGRSWVLRAGLGVIRLGERGSVRTKIEKLRGNFLAPSVD